MRTLEHAIPVGHLRHLNQAGEISEVWMIPLNVNGFQPVCDVGDHRWSGPQSYTNSGQQIHPGHYSATTDLWHHQMTAHARYLVKEPTWEQLVTGDGLPRPAIAGRTLGVPFEPALVRGLRLVVSDIKEFVRDIGHVLGIGRY